MLKPVHFLAASLFTSYPDEHFVEFLKNLISDPEFVLPDNLRDILNSCIKNNSYLDNLRSEYIDLFDRGPSFNSLYETEYGRDRAMVKGTELADLAGFYKAFGFEMHDQEGKKEMRDHVAVEFEFYTLLLMKQEALKERGDQEGIEIVLDARKKFLKDHLGRFVSAIAENLAVKQSTLYSHIFSWCSEIVAHECKNLNVEINPTSWVAGQQEQEKITCGNIGCSA